MSIFAIEFFRSIQNINSSFDDVMISIRKYVVEIKSMRLRRTHQVSQFVKKVSDAKQIDVFAFFDFHNANFKQNYASDDY